MAGMKYVYIEYVPPQPNNFSDAVCEALRSFKDVGSIRVEGNGSIGEERVYTLALQVAILGEGADFPSRLDLAARLNNFEVKRIGGLRE